MKIALLAGIKKFDIAERPLPMLVSGQLFRGYYQGDHQSVTCAEIPPRS